MQLYRPLMDTKIASDLLVEPALNDVGGNHARRDVVVVGEEVRR